MKIIKIVISLLCVICTLFFFTSCNNTKNSNSSASTSKVNTTTVSANKNSTTTSEKITTTSTTRVSTTVPTSTINIVPKKSNPNNIYDSTGFVSVTDIIPDVKLDIRYASTYNFVGDVIDGYEDSLALLTYEAATALSKAAKKFRKKGYVIKIYDAYRPQKAVEHFVKWANDLSDTRMKEFFYPELDKSVLFGPYIAIYSGHSRGCTVDMTLYDTKIKKDVDMGGTFDYFGELSCPDYTGITDEQYNNRMYLRSVMVEYGFSPCQTEWWDFTYTNEPYPNTYFTFPVSKKSISYY